MEYIECIKSSTEDFTVGKIYEGFPEIITDSKRLVDVCSMDGRLWKFKPSTKEAYEAQNKPKSLVGRYLKALVDNAQNSKVIKNNLYKIESEDTSSVMFYTEFKPGITYGLTKAQEGVFFELMPEGFEPNQVCEDCNGEGQVLKAKLYPTGHTEVNETCDKCRGDGFIEKEPTNNPTVLGVELVKGEYYVMETGSQWIAKFDRIEDNIFYNEYSISLTTNSYYFGGVGLYELKFIKSISKANFSERLWLDKCIAASKFIPKEEALEEKEFVLPENWCCILTEESASTLLKWADIDLSLKIGYNYYVTHQKLWGNSNKKSYIEITFEQFKKYVLKEDTFIDTFNPLAEPSTKKQITIKTELLNKKSDLEFQEPVIIKSIKNKPKLIIINN